MSRKPRLPVSSPEPVLTWIDASAPRTCPLPEGPAPSLLPVGGKPIVPREAALSPTDLVMPLLLSAFLLLGAFPVLREWRDAHRALLSATRTASNPADARDIRTLRVSTEAHLASLLASTRERQHELVTRLCESEDWCAARSERLDRSSRLAALLAADAKSWGESGEAHAPLSPELFRDERAELERNLAGLPATPRPGSWRHALLSSELSLLEAVARGEAP